ncbi:hypothetical protein JX266_010287 [Neoarthrinium moseri]|uniref:uncharacterized protein n=1 Tax=Neoarthrinium moseri TaxID=1658444 RepID=UPI001FDBE0C0|nr:uncharacterized protein JN550_005388 [Neoarthrinium moseri]KAI1843461.1 hypothetical protein JX266_010287 [Neoarthrinium moseri]KAI1870460.1 hypothetical protein JN550_005388 [Neoarthrinium moseri]
MRTYAGLWRKRQFIPCWVLQGISVAILGVVASLLVGASTVVLAMGKGHEGFSWLGYSVDDLARVAVVVGSILLVFCIVTLAMCSAEVALYKTRKLSPVILLSFSCVKTFIWIVYFVAVLLAAAKGSPSALDLIIGIILVTTSIGQVVLSVTYTLKQRKGLLDRGDYADVESGGARNMASLPRSNTWRKSIPAITVNSRELTDTGYESYRNSAVSVSKHRDSEDSTAAIELDTRTMASSNYEDSAWTLASPPTSPGLTTVLSHPPIKRMYSPAEISDDLDRVDLALTGYYGVGLEGQTRR